ncbi:aegerolysin family protein [Kitasatospora sp. NPDC004799]|uniref:aegerolysin family protein n=1 Tax=Kitasatospora sp. NPDC004799 TaxID=3154460 RepID=UPI0033B56DEB
MRISARFASLAAVAAVGLGTIATGTAQAAPTTTDQAAPAGAQAALSAARSTTIRLHNGTGCTLYRTDYSLSHGIWTQGQEPPQWLGNTGEAVFQSESNGFMTGTEGTVTFTAQGCEDGWRNNATVRLHWNNPYAGSNSYDDDGTTRNIFRTTREGGGGDNAYVLWGAWKA